MTHDPVFHALVVDDDDKICQLVSRALATEKISADVASDGAEALKLFHQDLHNLIVTDLRMPNVHGHALAVKLLQREEAPEVFVLTSLAEPRLVKDLIRHGVKDVAIKPVDFKLYATKVRSIMDAAEAARSKHTSNSRLGKKLQQEGSQDLDYPLDSLEKIESYLISEMAQMPPELLAELINLQVGDDIEIPVGVKEFVSLLSRPSPYANNERRESNRVKVLFPVVCEAYDEDFRKVGRPFHAFLRDISDMGVGIVSLRYIEDRYLALGWSNDSGMGIRTFVEVIRCRAHNSLFEVGAQFIDLKN